MNRRRSNGEGSVYRRKDGRWEGAAYLGTVNGKVRRLRVYGQTRAEAHTKLTRIIEEARQGILPPEKTWKVGEYLDFWLERENGDLSHARDTRGSYASISNPIWGTTGSITSPYERCRIFLTTSLPTADQWRQSIKHVRC